MRELKKQANTPTYGVRLGGKGLKGGGMRAEELRDFDSFREKILRQKLTVL